MSLAYDCWIWGKRGKVKIKAENIHEASKKAKDRFPLHDGFFLCRSRDNVKDPPGIGIDCEVEIPLHGINLMGYVQA